MSLTGDGPQSAKTSLTNRIRHEEILDRFETAWRQGPRPKLAEFLVQAKLLNSERLTQELLRLDVHYRRQAGETPTPADYAGLFADAPSIITAVFSDDPPTQPPAEISATAADARSGNPPPAAASASPITIGATFGPYEILSKLGEGGMGAVYQARHQHLDKLVAIKVLPPQFTQVEESISRFKREMKAVGKIDHANIVRAMDAGEIDGTHYLAMEFVDGTDLTKIVKTKGPFSVAKACKALRQAASALSAAHQAGLVHRDVKPSNLLLSKSGQIKLLDLGLARLGEDAVLNTAVTVVGQAFGTPDFMAPEQWADSHTVDPRADLYALGCTLFFLLTGRPPYGDERYRTPLNKMAGHVSQPIPDLRAARPDVPEGVADIYRKLMAKNPDDRFQTAAELMEALAPFTSTKPLLDNSQVQATLPSATDSQPNVKHSPLNVGLLARLGATLLIVVAGLAWMLFPRSPAESVPAVASKQPKDGIEKSADPIPAGETHPEETTTPDAETPQPLGPAIAAAPFDADAAREHQAAWAAHLGVPAEYTNSIGMKFRLIPPGRYLRGSDDAQIAAALEIAKSYDLVEVIPTERPQHTVNLPQPFYLGMHEVTQQDFETVMGANPSWFSNMGLGKDKVGNLDTARHPVETVNRFLVVAFCNRLGEREQRTVLYADTGQQQFQRGEGDGYRLPTEAEWEFACRAGTTTNYWSGDAHDDLRRVAWFGPNAENRTHAVGTLPANPFGLHDMHGNVWEWTEDRFAPDAYQQLADDPPTDPRGPETGSDYVIRGGDWGYIDVSCRSACRKGNAPGTFGPSLGFRVALTVGAVQKSLQQEAEPEADDEPDSSAPNDDVASSAIFTSPDWEWTEPVSLGPEINTSQREMFPNLLGPERRIFFLRDDQLMVSTRASRDAAFPSPRPAVDPFTGIRKGASPLSRMNRQEIFGISMTDDGLLMVMAVRQTGRRRPRVVPDEAIWMCSRDRVGDGFGNAVRLPDSVNVRPVIRTPWISPDGLWLIVARPGAESLGAADLYQHTRASREEEFGPAQHLGSVANTEHWDFAGSLSRDRLVLFRSTRDGARDDGEKVETVMCVRSSADGPFERALPLDPQLQAYHPSAIHFSRDGRRIYFQGSKDGDERNLDLFMAERVPKTPATGK